MTTPGQQYVYVTSPSSGGSSRTAASQTGGGQGTSRTGSGRQQGSGSRSSTTTISGGNRNRTVTTTSGGQTSTQTTRDVRLPAGVPAFLGNRQTLFAAWMIAMILVGFDEWHNYHWLPRPARFWYTSLTYGILTLASLADAVVPLANAFGIGFTLMLLWQYYNGAGQFSSTSGSAS